MNKDIKELYVIVNITGKSEKEFTLDDKVYQNKSEADEIAKDKNKQIEKEQENIRWKDLYEVQTIYQLLDEERWNL